MINRINDLLAKDYGYFESSAKPLYRVVWSEDQFEHRLTSCTPEGLELVNPVVSYLPKYRQSHQNKFILERCLGIPDFVQTDLVDKYSYEPLHVFGVGKGDEINFDIFYGACKFIIEQVHLAAKRAMYSSNYKDPKATVIPEEQLYNKSVEVEKMMKFLFPDESDIADAIHYGEGVSVPSNYQANGTSQKVN